MRKMMSSLMIPAVLLLFAVAALLPMSQELDPDPVVQKTEPCTDRVFLADGRSYSWGSFTRWRGGHVTAFHVVDSGEVAAGPRASSIATLPATDFAFLSGAPAAADPSSVPVLEGRVTLEGFPARATGREVVEGEVYAPDTTPPGIWIALNHEEPLVGGFSGGCVRNARGEVVAVIMGASSMKLNGKTRHFARVIPIRSALAEHQGRSPEPRALALMHKPLPSLANWPEQSGFGRGGSASPEVAP